MFSSRTNWNLKPNPLSLRLKALQAAGSSVIDLTESNPTRCQFTNAKDELLAPLSNPANLNYQPDPKGLASARQAIRHDYDEKGIKLSEEQIFLTASTSEAYSFLFRLLLNAGECVLAPRPSYPLFDYLTSLNDVKPEFYAIQYQNGRWKVDLNSIKRACNTQTKALILVHPNNPTGSYLKTNELEEIVRFAKDKSLALISDEVFYDYGVSEDENRAPTLASCRDVLAFTLGGISKLLGLPQMKLAWIIAKGPNHSQLNQAIERLEVILDTYLSVNTLAQNALPHWFALKRTIQNEILSRIKMNRSFLLDQTSRESCVRCLDSEGGWYAILRLPEIQSEEEFAIELLEQDKVYVHPGYFFDFEEENVFVLSLLVHPNNFQEGVLRLFKRAQNKAREKYTLKK